MLNGMLGKPVYQHFAKIFQVGLRVTIQVVNNRLQPKECPGVFGAMLIYGRCTDDVSGRHAFPKRGRQATQFAQ